MQILKPIPIGIEDFKEIIDIGYYFVDKTLLIKDLIDNRAKVSLITRPRRFGKTLNMS
ncbi:MAG: AAA family ATPase, partial [Oscillospiraceae bacterium]|nr:AAA family ATPase [Oscillospiraceae bacterium]